MRTNIQTTKADTPPARPSAPAEREIADFRFRALLSTDEWAALPAATQRRFSCRLTGSRSEIYIGENIEMRMSRVGRLLAQLARLVGAPLPLKCETGNPAVVSVTEDARSGGQFWTRTYGWRSGFPQVIHSSKRFAGPTGLEEYLGCGVGMALTMDTRDDALNFRSAGFFVEILGRKWRVRDWLMPLKLVVRHVDRRSGQFDFILDLRGPDGGELIYQRGRFADVRRRGGAPWGGR